MKKFSASAILESRYPLALVAGLLLAAAFPKINLAGFAWIAPGLMLATALGTRGKKTFALGYVGGLTHYLISLSWLLRIPLAGFPILCWLALSAFLALFFGTWVWLCLKMLPVRSPLPDPADLRASLRGLEEMNWRQRSAWALACAAAWVAMEMIIARIFGGFPWNLLGASQVQIVPLIQIASITGIYGISFLVAWGSTSLLCATVALLARPGARSIWMSEIMPPMVGILAAFIFAFHQFSQSRAPTRAMRITLVQPSIPQTLIWDAKNDEARFRQLLQLSEQALTNETDLLIWPEAAVPRPLRYDEETFQAITGLAARHHVWLIVGSDDAEPRAGASDPKAMDYYNASFLISPRGELVARYKKRSLVMFGEYIPLTRWLPFIKVLTPWMPGSFTPGDRPVPFALTLQDPAPPGSAIAVQPGSDPDALDTAKTSVLICFEDVFPHSAREYAADDIDFLVNITNDGWFGEGAAQQQHADGAAFRAVENGLPLVRCANTGLTCWIDSRGRFRRIFTGAQGTIYGPGFLTVTVPLLPAGERRVPTFYHEHGDWFGWSCAGLTGLLLVPRRFLKSPAENPLCK